MFGLRPSHFFRPSAFGFRSSLPRRPLLPYYCAGGGLQEIFATRRNRQRAPCFSLNPRFSNCRGNSHSLAWEKADCSRNERGGVFETLEPAPEHEIGNPNIE